MERVWQGIGSLPTAEVPAGLAERVWRRAVSGGKSAKWLGIPRWAWGPLAAAAAVLVAFVVGFYAFVEKPLDAETQQMVQDIDILQNLDVLEHLDTLEQLGDGVLLLTTDPAKSGGPS